MAVYIIIPARYRSQRLPGKVLLDILGKPMLQHVYEKAKQTEADKVMIATDEQQIVDAAKAFHAEVYLTSSSHQTGTDRIAELVNKLKLNDDDIVIGMQADEPLMPISVINQLINILKQKSDVSIATLCVPLKSIDDVFNPEITKVILNGENRAIYFSHAAVPWYRDGFTVDEMPDDFIYYRHLGIYGYRVKFVKKYVAWQPSPLEAIEKLEQLRILWYGESIYVEVAKESVGPGVDTSMDIERVRNILLNQTIK